MAYEVTKIVRGRPYRYRVEAFRDPTTGKARSTWTYLGTGHERDGVPVPDGRKARSAATRAKLIAALARLLERSTLTDVTVAAVAAEAGLAHGTFYRHFKDVGDALRAAVADVAESISRLLAVDDGATLDRETERARFRAWTHALLLKPVERPGLLRAYIALAASDPGFAALNAQRRAARRASIAAHLRRLGDAGIAPIADPDTLAEVLRAIFEGLIRNAIVNNEVLTAEVVATTEDVIDRAVFGC